MNLDEFAKELTKYLNSIEEARVKNAHHDYRRSIFMIFAGKAFDLPLEEVELEKGVKAAKIRGRIDALYKDIVFEFKRNLDNEREKGKKELTNYLGSLQKDGTYFGVLTDGVIFEIYNLRDENLEKIDEVDLNKLSPKDTFLWFDCFLFSAKEQLPTSEDIIRRFGARSPVFVSCSQILRQMFQAKDDASVKVKFNEWDKLLAKVYGSSVASDELFIRHTYLSLLAKLIVYVALFKIRPKAKNKLLEIVSGEAFRSQGFPNLVESDFFAWVLSPNLEDEAYNLLSGLAQHLSVYDLTKINEDLLKELYQQLVDPQTRHDLGEYYTPDWLAELALRESGFKKGLSILDPACGSGTFLFTAIKTLKAQGLRGTALVDEATEKIAGMDVHPVAVTIAKVNYILALASELPGYSKGVIVPIYLADSLVTKTEITLAGETVSIQVGEGEVFEIPKETAEHPEVLDQVIDEMRLYAEKPEEASRGFAAYLQNRGLHKWEWHWLQNLKLMRKLVSENRNTIWAFILKNFSRPVFFGRQGFHIVAGNPPWLAYRYVRDPNYQKQIKKLVLDYKLLGKKDTKLFTHMDTSTLFYSLSADLYLVSKGNIAFVMPRSVVTGAKHHEKFKRILSSELSSPVYLAVREFVDLGYVSPLFNVPSCVIIAQKAFDKNLKETAKLTVSGKLKKRNAVWSEAEKELEFESKKIPIEELLPPTAVVSYYFNRFKQGATIVPRFMWFVEPALVGGLGVIDHTKPSLKTESSIDKNAKEPWKGNSLQGAVESKFLYATLLAGNLIPFGYTKLNLLVLPLEATAKGSEIVESSRALKIGYSAGADWFSQAENLWNNKRKQGVQEDIYEWLNYRQKLTKQHSLGFYNVLYNTSGTNLACCVIDAREAGSLQAEGLGTRGFVADAKTYIFQSEEGNEAHFLCALLNSAYVNDAIKPYQTRGTWGERDIHRRPFEVLAIPQFAPSNQIHLKLAELSKQCHKKVETLQNQVQGKSIGYQRGKIRQALSSELAKIDGLVKKLVS